MSYSNGSMDCGKRMRRVLAMAMALWWVLAIAPSVAVAAQDPDELMDSLTDEEEAKVIELLDDGQEAYARGHLRDALRHFNEVYRLFPHPDVNYRVARIYDRLGEDEMAVQHYRHFLEEVPDDPERDEIEATIEELEEGMADDPSGVRFETFPIGASVYVDDRATVAVGETPLDVHLPPGTHDIYIDKQGYEQVEKTVRVAEGHMDLEQLNLVEDTSERDGPSQRASSSGQGRWMPVVSVGLAGGGGLLLHQAFGYRFEYRETGDDDARSQGITFGVVGGAMVASSLVLTGWWLMRDRSPDRGLSVVPSVDGGASVGVFGRF